MKLGSDPRDWQPFTFRGVAALATGPARRLTKIQLMATGWVVGTLAWFLATGWWPVVDAAAERLPHTAGIQNGTLLWEAPIPEVIAENRFLAITIGREITEGRISTSDLEFELTERGLRVHSLVGHRWIHYPTGCRVTLSRMEFQAWWGAWRWPLLAMVSGVAFAAFMSGWLLLASLYALWVKLFAYYADRQATRRACWRLAAAAQVPSAVLVGAAILGYGMHRLNFVAFLFALVIQAGIGWIYVLAAPFWLPRHPGALSSNPFRK